MSIYRVENPWEYSQKMQDIKVKCPHCGHTNTMPVFVDAKICNWCKNKIYNNSPAYFKYKLRKEMKKYEKEIKKNKMEKDRRYDS